MRIGNEREIVVLDVVFNIGLFAAGLDLRTTGRRRGICEHRRMSDHSFCSALVLRATRRVLLGLTALAVFASCAAPAGAVSTTEWSPRNLVPNSLAIDGTGVPWFTSYGTIAAEETQDRLPGVIGRVRDERVELFSTKIGGTYNMTRRAGEGLVFTEGTGPARLTLLEPSGAQRSIATQAAAIRGKIAVVGDIAYFANFVRKTTVGPGPAQNQLARVSLRGGPIDSRTVPYSYGELGAPAAMPDGSAYVATQVLTGVSSSTAFLVRFGVFGGPEAPIALPGQYVQRDMKFGPDGLLYVPVISPRPGEGSSVGTMVAFNPASGSIVRAYPLPTPSSPWEIAFAGGDLFYTDRDRPAIQRLDLAGGGVTEYPLRTRMSNDKAEGGGIAAAPNGDIWYTNWAGAIGRLRLHGNATSVEAGMVATGGFATQVSCTAACSGTARLQIAQPRAGARAASTARSRWRTVGSRTIKREGVVSVRPSARHKSSIRARRSGRIRVLVRVRDGRKVRTSQTIATLRRGRARLVR